MNNQKSKLVLVAAIGTSPAVLTETIWAMAHDKNVGLPDQIEVVTTLKGKNKIEKALLSGKPSEWEELIRSLKAEKMAIPVELRFGRANISVIPDEKGDEAEDLRTPGDNMRAADKMLEVIRKHTENPETVVYASIAGGRKSMSALMFSCMSLLGRTDDRVTHVLTMPDATGMVSLKDGGMFYFPKKGHTYEYCSRDSRQKIAAGKVAIEMFDVPFVRMRGWYQEKFGSIPPSYGTLVTAVQEKAPPAENQLPLIEMDIGTGRVRVDDVDCPLRDGSRMLMYLCLRGCFDKANRLTVLEQISQFRSKSLGGYPRWFRDYLASSRSRGKDGEYNQETLSNASNELRGDLSKRLRGDIVSRLCPRRSLPGSYPQNRIRVVGEECFPELCCLVKPD